MLGADADEVVIDYEDHLLADELELGHHLVDGSPTELAAIEGADAAEAAVERTPPGGLDGPAEVPGGQEVVPGWGNAVHARVATTVQGLQVPGRDILQNLGPGALGLAQDHGVRVFTGLL